MMCLSLGTWTPSLFQVGDHSAFVCIFRKVAPKQLEGNMTGASGNGLTLELSIPLSLDFVNQSMLSMIVTSRLQALPLWQVHLILIVLIAQTLLILPELPASLTHHLTPTTPPSRLSLLLMLLRWSAV